MGDRVMTVREVARYLCVHPNTIYRLAQQGRLPAFRIGSDWRFNRESIDAWRLVQEAQCAQPSPSTLANEFLEIVLWFHQEALQESVTVNDLRVFSSAPEASILLELKRLVDFGLLAERAAGQEQHYWLTPYGLERSRKFSASRSEIAGHGAVLHCGYPEAPTAEPRRPSESKESR